MDSKQQLEASDSLLSSNAFPLTIQIALDDTIGYAAIQNNVPVIRAISFTNSSEIALEAFEAFVNCSPTFAVGVKFRFERLAPGEIRKISPVDLQPDHGYLSRLDESEKAVVSVNATSGEGNVVGESTAKIEVLAYDQWAGTRSLPELLAAFCMPNSVVVDRLIGNASGLLRESGKDLSMNGYQTKNREKVWKQASAIYSTLLNEDLQYSNPPASFGVDGQKIRNPERILEGRVATCLDLAMLFASCFEQAGLHPVILFKEGHAWVGVWLVDTCFPTAIVDDVQSVRKRVKSGEFLVLETTGAAGGQKPSLRWAIAKGNEYLEEDGVFQYAVDIRRARELQIRPLPSKSAVEQSNVPVAAVSAAPSIEEMPDLPPLDPAALPVTELDVPDTPEGRLSRWKSKLLDLTLRNRLLNFKATKTALRVICPDPCALEDSLSEGKEFKIRAVPPVMTGSDNRDASVFANRNNTSPHDALARDALERYEILVDVPDGQLDARMLEIFRAAGTGLEEGGANTLFLVFGMLEWQEEKDAEAHHLAPILLVPVTLSRQSVRSGFRLTRHDDDAIVNPTLLQKLWQDFNLKLPSFDILPTDAKGIDVGKILQIFRMQVADIKGWEVKEQVHLGIFSFTKYLMWKDLNSRQEQLQQNAVVAHLINNPGKTFSDSEVGFETTTLDDMYRPQDLFAPMLSDSSQLRAICVASAEKNLVVEGPPGTGKSQTITNLIAHLLATGKTVLFVSEKMAALEVVHRRLNGLGLGAFCFELHSAKAKKSDVLKQLGSALEAAGHRTVKDWEMEAERLASLRQELNALAHALHRVHNNDLAIYDAIGICVKHGDKRPAPMSWVDANVHNRGDLETLREIARQMVALASQLSTLSAHPLSEIKKVDWTPSWEDEFLSAAESLAQAAEQLQEISSPTLKLFGLSPNGQSLSQYAALDVLADVLIQAPRVPIGVARAAHDEATTTKLRYLRQHGIQRQQAWDSLDARYREEVATLNASELRLQWAQAQNTWWPRKWFEKRSIFGRLRLFRVDNKRPHDSDIPDFLESLGKLNIEDKVIESMSGEASSLLQEGFAAEKTNWLEVASCADWAQSFASAVVQMAGQDPDDVLKLRTKLQPYVTDSRAMLKPDGSLGGALIRYRDAYRTFMAQLQHVIEVGCCPGLYGQDGNAPAAITRLLGRIQGWRLAKRQLQPWSLWQKSREKAIAHGLPGLVLVLETGDVPLKDVSEFFEFSYQNWWLRKAIDREPVLCSFSSADHERKITEFRLADERFQKLSQQYIVAKLSGQIPSSAGMIPGADSEMGKLRRELQKQRNHLPVRQLVQNLPTLLPKLKPCMLMSPLSVAQYLDASHAAFDVVIFDEASQIPVWDAVGVIARGRQLVCVGDQKQLPPTNFFNRSESGDDVSGEDEIQDLESILDECLSIGMPKLTLNWHYRSRHESLIAFSNITYYENQLVTFPSPVTEDRGVRFERVNGAYDRGGSRTNRAEADAIVKSIEMHFTDPARQSQSLGVVTFNQAQQSLIERLLDARRRESVKLDQAIAQVSGEALFIKNIENVQGDERDVIYFSITYGPDAAGKVNLNFGPLNLEGGQRRLNVAVSRARQAVVIFSTLMPEHIDLSKVRAAGVRDLKNYLEFALRGPRALIAQSIPTGMEPDSPFEVQVISALREKGWTVHPQVGVSGYRIDIGVVDPRAPGRYLLGVECDGRTYHSGATARDRDRLRQHVLEGLGWELYRIWSTDWWINPQEPLRKLLLRLEGLVAEDASPQESAPEQVTTEAPIEEHVTSELYARQEQIIAEIALPAFARYEKTVLTEMTSDMFYSDESNSVLRSQLLKVINHEGPVASFVVFRTVARAWNLSRTGRRIEERLSGLVPGHVAVTGDSTKFYWPEGIVPREWQWFRIPGEEPETRRMAEEICDEEFGNLALFVLAEHGSTSVQDLARSICRLLGISRTTSESEERVAHAVQIGRAGKEVVVKDGMAWIRRE